MVSGYCCVVGGALVSEVDAEVVRVLLDLLEPFHALLAEVGVDQGRRCDRVSTTRGDKIKPHTNERTGDSLDDGVPGDLRAH